MSAVPRLVSLVVSLFCVRPPLPLPVAGILYMSQFLRSIYDTLLYGCLVRN